LKPTLLHAGFGPIPLKKSVFEQDGRNSQREPTAS
jgi:hypothetical protein